MEDMQSSEQRSSQDVYDIVPPHLAIRAMRSSGFKSTDHAVAELIDNSIQAGLACGNDVTNVEVVCLERPVQIGSRQAKRIDEIIVYDNASGMNPSLLRKALMFGHGTNLDPENQKGIGKFGMGLPNASISQCRFVEVYSWQNGECRHTFLSVDQILDGKMREVPEPQVKAFPEHYKRLVKSNIGDSGTLVIWRNLDKTTWVRHRAFFRNSEFLIGRLYRRFIADGSVKIRFGAYDAVDHSNYEFLDELYVRPNDPLMLTFGTSAPDEFAETAAFEEFGNPDVLKVTLPDGRESEIIIRYSVAKQDTRLAGEGGGAGGATPIGKFLKRNVGVSIVRAGRELEMNQSWVNPSEPRERWWGIEIEFQPELDDIFGVTNDKQAATNLYAADYKEDADTLGMSASELMEQLQETKDPKLANYRVSMAMASRLKTLREHIRKQNAGSRQAKEKSRRAETTATKVTEIRAAQKATASDTAFANATEDERRQAVKKAYLDSGYDEAHAETLSIEAVSSGIRYMFSEAALSSPAIFDLAQERGEYFIKLNTRHPAYKNFIELLREDEASEDSPALVALKLLLTAWARMEDEATDRELDMLQDVRLSWGQIARDFMREIDS
ncbi:ATP-binding protein [Vannielia litorea]|uniref:ATP-binding protein n=1 Tax=Vannielia litorea TaxID=1217970 RepID=UPI001BCCC0D9|nr:ATP-binding protein [Vannielia litorea]MBS8225753.1 ATP-binding protein [Vannielia litorea]